LWGAVVRAPGVGTEVDELQYTAAPQVGGSGGVLGYLWPACAGCADGG
jgi:hypothetical protein